jgi:plasmid stabilization system protein ParE
MIELRVSEAAAHSIIEQADYYRQGLDDSLALRWESAVDSAMHSLLNMPERGTPCRFRSPSLVGMRWIFVPGFPKHMLFYRYSADKQIVLVVQVLHGARNVDLILK